LKDSHHHSLARKTFMRSSIPLRLIIVNRYTRNHPTRAARIIHEFSQSSYMSGNTTENPIHMMMVNGMPTRRKSPNL
jgi:hypothetical protein